MTRFQRALGISVRRWDRDPAGNCMGGCEVHFTSRDLLRLGSLYAHDGVVGDRRLLLEGWVADAFVDRRHAGPRAPGFGYGWWLFNSFAGPVRVAYGDGGQTLALYPQLDLAVVITCSVDGRGVSQQMIEKFLLHTVPAACAKQQPPADDRSTLSHRPAMDLAGLSD